MSESPVVAPLHPIKFQLNLEHMVWVEMNVWRNEDFQDVSDMAAIIKDNHE